MRAAMDDTEQEEKKKKTDRERRADARKDAAKRICGPCRHLHGDHAPMAGRDADKLWCYVCYELCNAPRRNRAH